MKININYKINGIYTFLILQLGVILMRTIRTVNFLAIALKTEKDKVRCMLNYYLN